MKRFGLVLLTLFLLIPVLASVVRASTEGVFATVRMLMFYSGNSESSMGIVEGFLPALKEVYDIEVRLYDVSTSQNYALLLDLEDRYGLEGSELPVFFVGEKVIAGEAQILERLEPTIAAYQARGGCEFPDVPDEVTEAVQRLSHPVYVAYFYQHGCPECDRVGLLLGHLERKYDGLVVREIDIHTPEGKILNESLSERMDVPEPARLTTPSVFFARHALVGKEAITSSLEGLIRGYAAQDVLEPPWQTARGDASQAERRIVERFEALGLSTVVVAGLIDGVNPCAFATLILFISYLAFAGRGRREILMVGLAFCLTIFVTYFLVGLGLLRVIQSFVEAPIVGRVVYLTGIGLAGLFGVLSLYDYRLCRRGRSSDMVLQMPAFLKDRVRGVIRKKVKVNRYILAAAVTGFVVSLLELACTGQVYLPTILFVSKVQKLRLTAMGYLAIYNLMFIVPLLGVFVLVYCGTGSERLAVLFQRHVSWVKLATALVFFALAGALSVSFL